MKVYYFLQNPWSLCILRFVFDGNGANGCFTISADNGINPIWNDICEFELTNPELALIRFLVQDEDMFGDRNFIGQATFPVKCLRSGYRSVPLTNAFSEELELASLLVHISFITNR